MELCFCRVILIITLTTNLRFSLGADFPDETGLSNVAIRTTRSLGDEVPRRSSESVSQRVQKSDNTKPIFKNCNSDNLNATIKENTKAGAVVTTVFATDVDPPEQGGNITYKIIMRDNERGKFKINNRTGEITNIVEFDRDEPLRQKEEYITVQAIDNGRPPLADVCSFKVTILDDNDNSPIFDKASYEEIVPVDMRVNSEVMRISATDIDDGDNAKITYSIHVNETLKDFEEYFKIGKNTGVVTLIKSLNGKLNHKFRAEVIAKDSGVNARQTITEIEIKVVESGKKPPMFIQYPSAPITLQEDYSKYHDSIAYLTASSNIENDERVLYELLIGKTQQSNRDNTFKLVPIGKNEAKILLGRRLDYESINEYTLTVRIQNADFLGASININIKILDVNDNIPSFNEVVQGSVLENEPPGTPVMQVRAIDQDGTDANNIVTYKLVNPEHTLLFDIDAHTGNITTKKAFDREEISSYNIRIKAEDNSPTALVKGSSEHNSDTQDFQIIIDDRNDNPPKFQKTEYIADQVLESSDKGKVVIEIKATDNDTASQINYDITEGNIDNAFEVERETGEIRVKNKLDFEKIENYTLRVEAYDGKFSDNATVIIKLVNVNDEVPVFDFFDNNITIMEETKQSGCILNLNARDPDVKDPSAPQNIVYKVLPPSNEVEFLSIDNNGCLMLTKPLDRDPPNGLATRQSIIVAHDENGGPTSQKNATAVYIHLVDINDNAPYLKINEIVWYENQLPGGITLLQGEDNDSDDNGAPFTFRLGEDVDSDIRGKFDIRNGYLHALQQFDREEQKFYMVPIDITDSPKDPEKNPPMTGRSYMKVIIGDINDNKMQPGSSEIFVYDYKGQSPDVAIGRVFVEDLDDWDLPDKSFAWRQSPDTHFLLNPENGTLIKLQGTPPGTYDLEFEVTERIFDSEHTVHAQVHVVVKEIVEEAVVKSGSIRVEGVTPEEFVQKEKDDKSKKDVLQMMLAKKLNTSLDNVDVFAVFSSPKNNSLMDVRFSAHGSPYYFPEKLNNEITVLQHELVKSIGGKILMINIDECLLESVCPVQSSCSNHLKINDYPAVVYTNKTSFVGVSAVVEAICACSVGEEGPINNIECLHGGTPIENSLCNCPPGYSGPKCEQLDVGFNGDGWALYPTFDACNYSEIALHVSPNNDNSLIFYVGPQSVEPSPLVRDFMALELRDGYPVLLVDYGTGTAKIEKRFKKLTDGNRHLIEIKLQPDSITMTVDGCANTSCMAYNGTPGANKLLNVNGPLQLGGIAQPNLMNKLAKVLGWEMIPTELGFHGCVRDLKFNDRTYDLGSPAMAKYLQLSCDASTAKAVTFGIDTNFLIAILICIAILIFLLLAVVVHRKKHDNLNEKDIDDIRENIINYEDEGGGEVDTGYDLEILRRGSMGPYIGKPPIKEGVYGECPEVPDISGFLDTKKDVCDKDPDNNPFDDVRHYAYEGDGNTSGSLSSLASCTDEGDLKFNYLSNFGPRFRKLADMYGEDPSDDDSHEGGEESWC